MPYEIELEIRKQQKKFENGLYRYFYCENCDNAVIKLKGEGHVIGKVFAWYCDDCKIFYISDKLDVKSIKRIDLRKKAIEYQNKNKIKP